MATIPRKPRFTAETNYSLYHLRFCEYQQSEVQMSFTKTHSDSDGEDTPVIYPVYTRYPEPSQLIWAWDWY